MSGQLGKAKKGYLTMNTGGIKNFDNSSDKLTIDEIKQYLPHISLLKEEPLSCKTNYIIIWGSENNNIDKHFTTLQI